MRQRSYGRDPELTIRMFFTIFMLGIVYVAFIGLLFWAGISPIFIGILAIGMAVFQYYGSDKLVLTATRAKVVSPEEEPTCDSLKKRDSYSIRSSPLSLRTLTRKSATC